MSGGEQAGSYNVEHMLALEKARNNDVLLDMLEERRQLKGSLQYQTNVLYAVAKQLGCEVNQIQDVLKERLARLACLEKQPAKATEK